MSKLDSLGLNINQSCAWLHDRTILMGVVGSHAYGTATEDSDLDYKGIAVPPTEYYLGLHTFNDYNTTGGKNWKNTKDDKDFSIMHVNKFIIDCMRGVPNNLELLFLKPELYVIKHPLADELFEIRNEFITKALKHKFKGFAYAQIEKLKAKSSNGTGRQDLIEKHNFDTKFAAHAVRLLSKVVEVLETGKYEAFSSNYSHLQDIRAGKYTLVEVLLEIEGLQGRLELLYETSDKIPYAPDFDKVNKWLIHFNEKAMKELDEEEYFAKHFRNEPWYKRLLYYMTK